MNSDTVEAAHEFSGILTDLGILHVLGGSLASITWGEHRFTADADFVLDLRLESVGPLIERLGDEWYADRVMIEAAVQRQGSFNLIRLKGMVKVDVFVCPPTGFDGSKYERAQLEQLDPARESLVPITSPEDIVLQKLLWYRLGDETSEQQWRDLTALLRIRAALLNNDYLDTWAARLDLTDLLTRARQDATK